MKQGWREFSLRVLSHFSDTFLTLMDASLRQPRPRWGLDWACDSSVVRGYLILVIQRYRNRTPQRRGKAPGASVFLSIISNTFLI